MDYGWTTGERSQIQLPSPVEMDQWCALAMIILWRDVLTRTIDDGSCIIDIFPQEQGGDGMVLPKQLIDAATELVDRCVVNGNGVGGVITDVGK